MLLYDSEVGEPLILLNVFILKFLKHVFNLTAPPTPTSEQFLFTCLYFSCLSYYRGKYRQKSNFQKLHVLYI